MDLIYTDENLLDLGILKDYDFDLEIGTENDFQITTSLDNSDILKFTIEQHKRPVNHLICLGQGELAQRTVINLYTDANGNVSQTQYFTGLDEVTEVYDYSSVESVEELLKAGTEKLLEYQKSDEIRITIENAEKDVGDIVGGYEVVTGMKITGEINKKIVKIENNNDPKFSYEVGK